MLLGSRGHETVGVLPESLPAAVRAKVVGLPTVFQRQCSRFAYSHSADRIGHEVVALILINGFNLKIGIDESEETLLYPIGQMRRHIGSCVTNNLERVRCSFNILT